MRPGRWRSSAPAPSRRSGARRTPGARRTALAAAVLLSLCPGSYAGASVLDTGLALIERSYLFYQELDADHLMGESLKYVESRVPQVRAWEAAPRVYLVSAGPCLLRVEIEERSSVTDLARPLREVAALVADCVDELDDGLPAPEPLLLNGVLAGLDPYSTLLDARNRTEHSIQFNGKLAGIGARIGIRDNALTLITVYPDSPAAKAGLRDGDIVRRIDELSATNILVSDAVQRIRGDAGTTVLLTIERLGEEGSQEITVTRGVVMIPSVTAKMLDGGIISAEISHFSQTTPQDFRSHVAKLVAENDVRGIVIDLRRNSGGSMLGSSAIGDLFLDHGVLITTVGRDGRPAGGLASRIEAQEETPFARMPVAFLTSQRTASGSELLAASLRNNDRAILVGERSYGKGTIQKTYNIGEDNTVKLSVGRFLPNERPIPGGGLVPDVEVEGYRFSPSSVAIPVIREHRELPFWLKAPSWAKGANHKPWFRLSFGEEVSSESLEKSSTEPAAAGGDEDEQPARDHALEVAADILREYGSTSAKQMLEAAIPLLARRAAETDRALTALMKAKGIDWSRGTRGETAPDLAVSVQTQQPLAAGRESLLTVTAKNNGKSALSRVRGFLKSDSGLVNRRPLLFGRLEPGQSKSWKLKIEPPAATRTGRIEAEAELFDDYGQLAELGPLRLAVEEGTRPRISYRFRVAQGETPGALTLSLWVRNNGDAAAEKLQARVEHPLSGEFEIVSGQATVDSLAPGEEKELSLAVSMLESFGTPPAAKVMVVVPGYGILLEQEVALAPAATAGRWHEPPRIKLEGLTATTDDGVYNLIVTAVDDGGVKSLQARVDGETVRFVEPLGGRSRSVRLQLPWRPTDGVKPFRFTATDNDGLTEIYSTEL